MMFRTKLIPVFLFVIMFATSLSGQNLDEQLEQAYQMILEGETLEAKELLEVMIKNHSYYDALPYYWTALCGSEKSKEDNKFFLQYVDKASELNHHWGAVYKAKHARQIIDETRRMADEGNAVAQYVLSWNYNYNTRGVRRSNDQSFKYMKMAASEGLDCAQYATSIRYSKGWGVEKNIDSAIYWMQLSYDGKPSKRKAKKLKKFKKLKNNDKS